MRGTLSHSPFTAVLFAVSAGYSAEPVTEAAPAAPAAAEVITLTPFEVTSTQDRGYRATNTLEGSRLNTPLRDTPGAISIFTRDLLEDLGATEVRDLIRYDLNSVESYADNGFGGGGDQVGNLGENPAWRTRGLTASASTDGFRTVGSSDTYNVERVGSTRGPNAILFGTGAPGGVLNFATRRANPSRDIAELEFKLTSNSTRRGVIDFNRPLRKDKAALRVVGLREERGSHQPHKYLDKRAVTVGGQYRFAPHTALTVSYERNRTKGVDGRAWTAVDSVTQFLGALEGGQVVWNAARERYETLNGAVVGASSGVGNLSPRTVLVYGPDLGAASLWEGASATANRVTLSTSASQFTGERPLVPETIEPLGRVTSTGAAEYGEIDFSNLTATFNHRWFDKLYMELAYNHSVRESDAIIAQNPELRADLNYRLPDGTLNPWFFGNGYYFSQQVYLRQRRGNTNKTLRAALSYELDLGRRWGTHRFAVMAERHANQEMRNRVREVWADRAFGGNPEAAANHVTRRRYFKIGGPLANYTPGYNPVNPFLRESYTSSNVRAGDVRTDWVAANALNFDDEITTDSAMVVMQNHLFERRLVTTIGLREDRIDTWGPRTLRDATTQNWRLATAADQAAYAPLGQDWFESAEERGQRHSFGGVFHLTKNFSLTANTSDGIELNDRNRTVLPTESVPAPYRGKSRDYGLGFSFLDGRIGGSLKYFESSSRGENNNGRVGTTFVQPNNDVMASFDYYFRQAGLTTFGASDPIRSVEELRTIYLADADSYLFDRLSRGVEFETIANITRNWTLRLNYAYTKESKLNVMNEGVPWWADRVALWKQLDAIYIARTSRPSVLAQRLYDRNDAFATGTVANRIADADRELATVRSEEERGYGSRRHKSNVWTRYSFTKGRLKGVSVGGGWRFQSKNIAGVDFASGRLLYGNPRSVGDFMLQYRTKGIWGLVRRARATYQLNIANVLDDRTIVVTNLGTDDLTGAVYMRRGFREEPRSISFSVRTEL